MPRELSPEPSPPAPPVVETPIAAPLEEIEPPVISMELGSIPWPCPPSLPEWKLSADLPLHPAAPVMLTLTGFGPAVDDPEPAAGAGGGGLPLLHSAANAGEASSMVASAVAPSSEEVDLRRIAVALFMILPLFTVA